MLALRDKKSLLEFVIHPKSEGKKRVTDVWDVRNNVGIVYGTIKWKSSLDSYCLYPNKSLTYELAFSQQDLEKISAHLKEQTKYIKVKECHQS
jgi:hypothetical protein